MNTPESCENYGMQHESVVITPQPGPQTEFLSTHADIGIYGGAAGGGKSFGLVLDPLRHVDNPLFAGVIFRRTTPQIRNPGGLWDETQKVYPMLQAKARQDTLEWLFPTGMRLKLAHLEHDKTVLEWQGSQLPFIGFDELTHFTEDQFWYMLSRNRSLSGVKPYIRATTNPDRDSWVRKLIDWWIDPLSGLPIKERSGKLRWFVRRGSVLYWADTPEELVEKFGNSKDTIPKSLTFISASLSDNQILMQKDPGYRANLLAMNRVDRAKYLDGNWNARAEAGLLFKAKDFPVMDSLAGVNIVRRIRYWDRAATKPSEANPDPDWTVGLLMGQTDTGLSVVLDVERFRDTPMVVEESVKRIAQLDGVETIVWLEQDPGSAGVADVDHMVKYLAGFNVRVAKPTKNKVVRAGPVSAQSERGQVVILRRPWNEAFLVEVESCPVEQGKGHDDIVDCLSGAFNEITKGVSLCDVL